MDSGVSEASTQPWTADPQTANPVVSTGAARPGQGKSVKRQASAMLGSELLQSNQASQQQVGWVQLWPATYQLQQQHFAGLAAPWAATGAVPAVVAQQSQLGAAFIQPQLQLSTAGVRDDGYGYETASGTMSSAIGMQAAVPRPAAVRAPHHRLPKRRASAPHLLNVANLVQPMYRCTPHVATPDCQCTQCLCARTDELCKRLIAQRNAQAAVGSAAQGAASCPGEPGPQLLQQPAALQHPEQAAAAAARSPVHGKRRSMELPPLVNNRRSPGRTSPSSPQQQQQQCQQHKGLPTPFGACSSGMLGTMAAAGCADTTALAATSAGLSLSPVNSSQLRGQLHGLSVGTINPFEHTTAGYAAAAAAAASAGNIQQHSQLPARAQQASGLGVADAGSCHSMAGAEDDAAVDRELEQLLSQVGWPLEPMALGSRMQQPPQAQPQQQPRPQHLLSQGGAGMTGMALASRSAYHQQQQAAVPAAVPAAPAAMQAAAVSSQLMPECCLKAGGLPVPSFDGWGGESLAHLAQNHCSGVDDCDLLHELLADDPEEACLADLLLD